MLHEAFSASSKASTVAFTLTLGGRYLFAASGTFSSAAVQVEDFAGNFLDIYGYFGESASVVAAKINNADGSTPSAILIDLPPGSYQFALSGNSSTAANVSIARVPLC